MKVINLTPHEVVIYDGDIVIARYKSDGVARALSTTSVVGVVEDQGVNIPIVKATFGAPIGLPEPCDGVFYVVSLITAQSARTHGRTTSDLFLTNNLVRNEEGQPIGCREFSQL